MSVSKTIVILIEGDRVACFFEKFPFANIYQTYTRTENGTILFQKDGKSREFKVSEFSSSNIQHLFRIRRAQSREALSKIYKMYAGAVIIITDLNSRSIGEVKNRPLRAIAKLLEDNTCLMFFPKDDFCRILPAEIQEHISIPD